MQAIERRAFGDGYKVNSTRLSLARRVQTGSALRFHGLTTQKPFEVWLAIERGARRPVSDTPPLRVHSFFGEAFTAGIETHELEGVPVRVYSAAKTVADCFKYRNKIGLEVALEALRDTLRQRKATVDEIWQWSELPYPSVYRLPTFAAAGCRSRRP